MCGIVGALDLNGRRMFSRGRLEAMCAAIRHRGPDDEHFHLEPGVALGARRLSIVDLAGGRQPLSNETGTIWVAFNGELFEYPELFERLAARGHRLATRCDTELWVHLYEDHQEGMFEQAKGQFAVSLWDGDRRKLILGRDRVGIVPLYYAQRDGWLLWSSEVKGLLASGLVDPKPDAANLDHFFTCYFSSSRSRSFFEGIHSLPPGTYLVAQDGRIEPRRYWQLDFPDAGGERRTARPDELLDGFEHVLRQSIRRRLRGDVPVVSYLSGGIDSTVVTTLACQESASPRPAYTIGLIDTGKNEQFEAAQTARHLGAPLTVVEMERRTMADCFPELIQAAEAPLIDTTCACMIRLAQRVRADGYKVTLSGEGADEALGGYSWGRRTVRPVRRAVVNVLARLLVPRIQYRDEEGSLRRVPFQGLAGVRPPQQLAYELMARNRQRLFSADAQRRLWGHCPLDELAPLPDRFPRWAALHQSLYLDYSVFLQGHLLSTKGDRPAMNASIESRPPFLDEDVVAFCARVAPEYKIRGGIQKWLLRRLASRWLPPEICQRPKRGFRASFSDILLGPSRPLWVDQLLSEESLLRAGLFDPSQVARCRALLQGRWPRPGVDLAMTAVISTQLWHHMFCGGGLADLPVWAPPIRTAELVAVT
jgi:asparagine synthase (glutamine-hydrolysing)